MHYVEVFLAARGYGYRNEVEVGPANDWSRNLAFRFRRPELRRFEPTPHAAPDPGDDAGHFALACAQVAQQLNTATWQIFLPDGSSCGYTGANVNATAIYDPFPPNHDWSPQGWEQRNGVLPHPTRAYLLHEYDGTNFTPYYEDFEVNDPNENVLRIEYWIVVRKI